MDTFDAVGPRVAVGDDRDGMASAAKGLDDEEPEPAEPTDDDRRTGDWRRIIHGTGRRQGGISRSKLPNEPSVSTHE
jgi:hypothetical protein